MQAAVTKISKAATKKIEAALKEISFICEAGSRAYGGYFEVFEVVEPLYYLLEKINKDVAEYAGLVMDAKEETVEKIDTLLNELYQQLSKFIYNY